MNQLQNVTTSPLAQPGTKQQWQDGVNLGGIPFYPMSPAPWHSDTLQEGNLFTQWPLAQWVLRCLLYSETILQLQNAHVQHVGIVSRCTQVRDFWEGEGGGEREREKERKKEGKKYLVGIFLSKIITPSKMHSAK